jgi:signal transduction histidine kinase
MIVGERLIGVMAVQSNQLNRFSEEDVVIHKILAAQVAVAIENARRFEALQQTILQLQETQEKLMRQETLAVLGQLAGGVGHELRNPLGVVSNAVYFLRAILTGADETVDEYLNLIDSRVQEAEKIVTDLLNLSGNRIADRARVSALQLVEETLARQPPPKSVETTIYIPSELPLLFIDPQQIRQVLINLVANAYQAMPEGGTLTIAARVVSKETKVSERGIEVEDSPPLPRSPAPLLSCIQLTIADTGIGMAADTMAKIFEPLYTTKSKGIGLGLAVSRHLIEVNGGRLEAQSAEGQGSTFTLTLPTKM